jgi:hypothetical protein
MQAKLLAKTQNKRKKTHPKSMRDLEERADEENNRPLKF